MAVPQDILPFKLIPDTDTSIVTSFAGLPLVLETMRALGAHTTVDATLAIKKRESGTYTESDYVESFVSLFAAGDPASMTLHGLKRTRALRTSASRSHLPNPPGSSSMPSMKKSP